MTMALVLAVGFFAFAAGFSPACPCIDPWANSATSGSCRPTGPGVSPAACVPLDYGASRCAAWDNHSWHPECGLPGAPDYCENEFCYATGTQVFKNE